MPEAKLRDVVEAVSGRPEGRFNPLGQLQPSINQTRDDRPSAGQEVYPRGQATQAGTALTSQRLALTYFTAYRTQTVASIRTYTGTIAAGATPTICRIGIYSIHPDTKDLTLIGSTANDTTLWAAASTAYTKALSVATPIVEGTRYALGLLVVSAAAMPSIVMTLPVVTVASEDPRHTAAIDGQANLPASVASGSLINVNVRPYAVLI